MKKYYASKNTKLIKEKIDKGDISFFEENGEAFIEKAIELLGIKNENDYIKNMFNLIHHLTIIQNKPMR